MKKGDTYRIQNKTLGGETFTEGIATLIEHQFDNHWTVEFGNGDRACRFVQESDRVEFTDKQLEDFRTFERVNASGKFNMFHQRAVIETGLTGDEYSYIKENYNALNVANNKATS